MKSLQSIENTKFNEAMYFQENSTVAVKEGQLKGEVKKLLDGSSYYSFKGVPYAQPPIGELRFQVT